MTSSCRQQTIQLLFGGHSLLPQVPLLFHPHHAVVIILCKRTSQYEVNKNVPKQPIAASPKHHPGPPIFPYRHQVQPTSLPNPTQHKFVYSNQIAQVRSSISNQHLRSNRRSSPTSRGRGSDYFMAFKFKQKQQFPLKFQGFLSPLNHATLSFDYAKTKCISICSIYLRDNTPRLTNHPYTIMQSLFVHSVCAPHYCNSNAQLFRDAKCLSLPIFYALCTNTKQKHG